jgi:hypothetical protein
MQNDILNDITLLTITWSELNRLSEIVVSYLQDKVIINKNKDVLNKTIEVDWRGKRTRQIAGISIRSIKSSIFRKAFK